MLVSYKWLSEYIDLSGITPQELAEKITRSGIEVDIIHERRKGIENVVVGYVQERVVHPNADKLSVCQVDLGEGEPVQIICGAPNVAAGQKVPVAKVGAILPDNFKIKKAKLRGEVSEGMICSAEELGIESRLVPTQFKEGIMVLPEDSQVGGSAIELLGLDDVVLELDLTPNRSDCLSMLGVAYEVGAILGRVVRLPDLKHEETATHVEDEVTVRTEAEDICPLYVAKKVKGVKIGTSPLWLQNRLTAAGIRPINNVVDVSNYVMLEYGQPLHTFDAAKVANGEIIIRSANQGEKVVTLDDQERVLQEGMLLITDPEKNIAIAGVMGAANSEVSNDTTDIIIESAYFAGPSVRITSKELGLRSEASARFEKGVDPERVYMAAERAALLISELAGGEILSGIAVDQKKEFEKKEVSLSLTKLNKVLGTKLDMGQVEEIMSKLSFETKVVDEQIFVQVPTRRQDITIEEDLIEEVARLYGYDQIPTTLPSGVTTPGVRSPRQQLRQRIKSLLQGAGLHQVITYSLTIKAHAEWQNVFTSSFHPIALAMPMSEERSHLRTTLVPSLLEVVGYNKNRKHSNVHLFEMGHTFITDEEQVSKLPEENEMLSGVLTGLWREHPWQQAKVTVDFYVAKGIVEGLFEKLEIKGVSFEPLQLSNYHPGRTAMIKHGHTVLGMIGQIHPQTETELDLNETYAFEISLDAIEKLLPEDIVYKALPKFPSIQRDLAVVVDQEVLVGDIAHVIEEIGAPLLSSVQLFDLYQGENIGQGKKSVAFSLSYLDPEKTLTDEQVQQVHDQVVAALGEKFKAELR